jgi:hypothetical protein
MEREIRHIQRTLSGVIGCDIRGNYDIRLSPKAIGEVEVASRK